MIRILLGSVLSALALFVFGIVSWMALGLHDGTVRQLPDQAAVTAMLREQQLATGVYSYPMAEPAPAAPPAEQRKAMDDFIALRREGPVFSVFYHAEGAEPFAPEVLGRGFGINFVCSLIAATLLWMAGPSLASYGQRVLFVALLGVFAAIFRDVALFNWMTFPWDYTQAMIVDVLISWVLAGLILGAIVKRPAASSVANGR
jgi:hypothetical protein